MNNEDFKLHANNDNRIKEIMDYIEYMKDAPETTKRFYTELDEYSDYKYSYVHKKLDEVGFVSGEPEENTFEKNPDAHFWWLMYRMLHPDYGFDHHASTSVRKANMIDKLYSLIEELEK